MSRADGPVKDPEARRAWIAAHSSHCQACGRTVAEAARMVCGLTCHHLIKRGRSDEPWNLLMLCIFCHDAAELRDTVVPGTGFKAPKLDWPAGLTIKRYRDPEEADLVRAGAVMGRAVFLGKVPRWFEDEYRRRRPGDTARFIPEEWLV